MRFHLILPGLLWPALALRDTVHDLPLPGLSWLLGRGRIHWQAPLPLEDWLCREFGGEQPPAPAALRLLGEGREPGRDFWLCADPLHMHFVQGRPSLSDRGLAIAAEEMSELAAALAPLFAEVGEFQIGQPGHGYLRLPALPQLLAAPPSAVIGRSHPLPAGADAARWLRLGNAAQMLLHGLPLNTRREAAGRPTLNSLWFWGAGVLPPHHSGPVGASNNSAAYARIIGRQALLPGLAAWSGIAHSEAAAEPAALLGQGQSTQLLLDDLLAPTQQLDANAWRAALLQVEGRWLQPALAALRAGRLHSLRLTALGDEAAFEVGLTRSSALKFWRRPQALHELRAPSGLAP